MQLGGCVAGGSVVSFQDLWSRCLQVVGWVGAEFPEGTERDGRSRPFLDARLVLVVATS